MSASKPQRKPTWYGRLFVFLFFLWFFGGVDALLLRDMPVFVCVAVFWALTSIPVPRLLGKPDRLQVSRFESEAFCGGARIGLAFFSNLA